MKAKQLNMIIIFIITIFMGYMLLFTERPGSDIAVSAFVMAILNSGVPINVTLDKLIELKKYK